MNNNLKFDFIVDNEKNTLTMKREFAANRQLVWDAHTKSELLNQWFAPSPMTTKTKSMDFSEGGYWLYVMIEPNGTEYGGRMDYVKINAIDYYSGIDAFTNEDGTINTDLPRAMWDVSFEEYNGNSLVTSVVRYDSLADLETVINMGMEEGMNSCLERLDNLLLKLTN